jgi:TrpR-related protein YerC/YecD
MTYGSDGLVPGEDWRTSTTDDLLDAVLRLQTREEAARFFRDLCTLGELHDLAQRWQVVRLLDAGRHYAVISQQTGASTATITRIAQWLHHGTGGYRVALGRVPTDAAIPPDMPRGAATPGRGPR